MPVFRQGNRNVLFVHVPKAGGSAVERLFAQSGWQTHYRDPKVKGSTLNRVRRCSPQHMQASLLEELFMLDRFDAVFMTVREPLARFRSEFAMRNGNHAGATPEEVDAWADHAFRRFGSNPYVFDNHLRPQVEFYLTGCHVYRLEDGLEDAVLDLNARFDLGLPTEVPRVMDRQSSSGSPSSEVPIGPALTARLRTAYHQDFALFGY